MALEKLLEFEGIKLRDVIGFGDDLNDLPFLNIIGHPVVMKNSNPVLLNQFKNICLSNDGEGIFNYLNEMDLLSLIS